jgi:hypothetical protein
MLLVPRVDGRLQPYVGRTSKPQQRLQQHKRKPPTGIVPHIRVFIYIAFLHQLLLSHVQDTISLSILSTCYAGVQQALAADKMSTDDVLYFPLEVVPSASATDSETRWSVDVNDPDSHGLNGFAFGNPTQQRLFWQRRAAQQARKKPRT